MVQGEYVCVCREYVCVCMWAGGIKSETNLLKKLVKKIGNEAYARAVSAEVDGVEVACCRWSTNTKIRRDGTFKTAVPPGEKTLNFFEKYSQKR